MIRILVIEDETLLRDEIVAGLRLEGYEALSAADGIEGLEVAFRQQPDLIICDIMMPRLDGYSVLLELHSNPITTDIPFIFVTARAARDDIRQGMHFGADDYITKPFTHFELLEAIEARLRKKALQEQKRQQQVDQWQQAFVQEREQRLLKAKMVAMLSHDLRNPVAGIIGTNDLLRELGDKMDEVRRRSHFDRVEASAHRLLSMLEEMLLMAQMESGNLDFQPEPLDVGQFVQGIVDEFQAVHRETHQVLFKNRASETMMADKRLLRQISSNLISNAIRYSPQSNEVYVGLDICENRCRLQVQDHGIGIPEADQQRLFSAFERGSNVGKIAGTGLGLAIVKQAVEAHKGSIRCESAIGRGTTFFVEFPILRAEQTLTGEEA